MSDYFSLSARIDSFAQRFLLREGWFADSPIDQQGPIPWFTYPAVHFLKDIISKENKVFEYGSGFSTLYFSKAVQELCAVEHNIEWHSKLLNENPQLNIILSVEGEKCTFENEMFLNEFLSLEFELPLSNNRPHNIEHGLLNYEFKNYAAQIFKWEKGYFDVVSVDGMARSLCGFYASKMVSEDGLIILDNSDRWQYNSLQNYLISNGFGRIDFYGPGPVNSHGWCTSFFQNGLSAKIKKLSGKSVQEILVGNNRAISANTFDRG